MHPSTAKPLSRAVPAAGQLPTDAAARVRRCLSAARGPLAIGLLLLATLPWSGCGLWLREGGMQWVTDYDTAERMRADSGRPAIIYYLASRRERNESLSAVLSEPEVAKAAGDCVRCRLFHEYEPDRRYVAQFGVTRAPALVVINPDGTFHARMGTATREEVLELLSRAASPGAAPAADQFLPRRVDYHWLGDVDEARRAAAERNVPALIVMYELFSRDWLALEQMLSQEIVHRRFASFVHCRVQTVLGWRAGAAAQFALTRLPAVVIVHPDGRFSTIEAPTSAEEIVHFANRSLTAPPPAAVETAATNGPA